MTRQLRNYVNDVATGHSWRDIAPEFRVRRWFFWSELVEFGVVVGSWAMLGASVGYALVILARSVGVL